MVKKKIVIRVQVNCEDCRIKAMKVASGFGCESVGIEGKERDELVVVGEGIDSVCLVNKLRKKLCGADIVKVEEVKPKEEPKKEEKKECEKKCPVCCYLPCCCPPPHHPCRSQMLMCHPITYETDAGGCTIM